MRRRQVLIRASFALSLLAVLALTGQEALWRTLHVAAGPAVSGPGWFSVEPRFLTEGEPLPYGHGVFLFPTLAPVRSISAKLVFVGYCANITLQWRSPSSVHVSCALAEGEPAVLIPEHFGVSVSHSVVSRGGS